MGEVWVIDSGSTDGTQEIARNRGAHVLEWEWPGYAKQRQRALSVGSHPWQGHIDADECLSPELRDSIRRFLADPGDVSGAWVARQVVFLGRTLRWGGMRRRWFLRLVRRRDASISIADLDEKIGAAGPTVRLRGTLIHEARQPLRDRVRTQIRYAELHPPEPRLYRKAPRAWRALALLLYRLIIQGGLLDGLPGLAYHGLGFAVRLLRDAYREEETLRARRSAQSEATVEARGGAGVTRR